MPAEAELQLVAQAIALGLRLDDRESLQIRPLEVESTPAHGALSHLLITTEEVSFHVYVKLQLQIDISSTMRVSITAREKAAELESLLEEGLGRRVEGTGMCWWVDFVTWQDLRACHIGVLARAALEALARVEMPSIKVIKH